MTRLQRLGLLVILLAILVFQAAFTEVLYHFTPAHLPLATRLMLAALVVGGGMAWMIEPRES